MMITAKRLALLLLTGIVIASVACGPSAEEQKELIQEQKTVLLCEDALERRADAERQIIDVDQFIHATQRQYDKAMQRLETNINDATSDIDKYCK